MVVGMCPSTSLYMSPQRVCTAATHGAKYLRRGYNDDEEEAAQFRPCVGMSPPWDIPCLKAISSPSSHDEAQPTGAALRRTTSLTFEILQLCVFHHDTQN